MQLKPGMTWLCNCATRPLLPPRPLWYAAPHLHEGVEQWVLVLLLPGISHGLLYSKAVLDIRLEPLAKLEEHI